MNNGSLIMKEKCAGDPLSGWGVRVGVAAACFGIGSLVAILFGMMTLSFILTVGGPVACLALLVAALYRFGWVDVLIGAVGSVFFWLTGAVIGAEVGVVVAFMIGHGLLDPDDWTRFLAFVFATIGAVAGAPAALRIFRAK